MARKSVWLGLALMALLRPAAAAVTGPFDQALTLYIQDGALDGREYTALRQLGNEGLPDEDLALARHFLAFAGRYRSFIHMSYSYYRGGSPVKISFAFAPTYAENDGISGSTSREILGQISQNDVLPETRFDSERCGAAALLAAHYLLFGSFRQAFALLKLTETNVTYRSVHLAQEALYNAANTDGSPGLVSMFRYSLHANGAIDKPVSEGEIRNAAARVRLQVSPMIGARKSTLYQRQAAIQAFWRQHPEAVFLVGVHLNEQTGAVWAPTAATPQNHFVLVFRQNNQLWLHNSGVLDNGNHSALQLLDARQAQSMFYFTQGSVDALTRL